MAQDQCRDRLGHPLRGFGRPGCCARLADRSRSGFVRNRLMTETPSDIAEIVAELRVQHRDLDDAIHRLADSPAPDQLQLTRLKKRKLRLKDQIAYWESKLIPDLDA